MNRPAAARSIPFIDLEAQRWRLGGSVNDAIARVLDHGRFIMGPEVTELEAALGGFCGAKEVVSCANGTDALGLVLMAKGVGPGDAVLCPAFTFAATAEAIAWTGAAPVLLDVDEVTFNITSESLEAGLATARREGLRPVGIIPVDLFGLPADYDAILEVAAVYRLWVLCDAAQSFGATYKGRSVGTIGAATSTSFFPAKPLGCYGDGGAVMTDDSELAGIMRSLRVHGQGIDRYDNVRIGINGRLDTIQAAILLEKLKIFPDEIEVRQRVAERYGNALSGVAMTPSVPAGSTSVWAQYTLRFPDGRRDRIADLLGARGVPTAIYYPKPLNQQAAYRHYPVAGGSLPVSTRIAGEVLSLPMHPYLKPDLQDFIIQEVIAAVHS